MLTILRTMFNNGENEGTITIKTKTNNIKCHAFVIENTSDFFKQQLRIPEFNGTISLDFSNDVAIVILNYMYCEKIVDKEFNTSEIIELYNLADLLSCEGYLNQLKQYYLEKFSSLITTDNWGILLNSIYGIQKFNDLQTCIIKFYEETILNNINSQTVNDIIYNFVSSSDGLKTLLFTTCMKKMVANNSENSKKKRMNEIIIDDTSDDNSGEDEHVKKTVRKTPSKK